VFLLDSNVLLDLAVDDEIWRTWSERAIEDALAEGSAAVNPVIYAELALGFPHPQALDRWLDELEIEKATLPFEATFSASRAYRRYRSLGGARPPPLPDFFIGAHALVSGLILISRDARRYRTYFPEVRLISPPDDNPGHRGGDPPDS